MIQGLTMHDVKEFSDLVTKANSEQLQAMKEGLEREQIRRTEVEEPYCCLCNSPCEKEELDQYGGHVKCAQDQ